MRKLKIKGLGSLELIGDVPELNKEYLLSILVERSGKRTDEKDKDNPIDIYELEYIRTEMLLECGSKKKIDVKNGKTPSQALRFQIEAVARAKGFDEDKYYQEEITKIINHYADKLK